MKAITADDIENASSQMFQVMQQMNIHGASEGFIVGANWAINEMERRKQMELPSIPDHEPQD